MAKCDDEYYRTGFACQVTWFFKIFGGIYKQNNIVDTATSQTILLTSFTGSSNSTVFSETCNNPVSSFGLSSSNAGITTIRVFEDPSFGKTGTNQSFYITKQTMSLITAP
jgi:hypothetical protein